MIEYKFEDHGVDSMDYWQGAGVANTEWDVCFTGMGMTPYEAAEDALDQAAVEYDVEAIPNDFPGHGQELEIDQSYYVVLYLKSK